jgi:hypothetical protein
MCLKRIHRRFRSRNLEFPGQAGSNGQEGFSMKLFRSARWLLLALLVSVVPASSFAGVFISVGFSPPVLPVYEQPICPDEGLMWMPGYWAYGEDGYYWVPGAWVPAPYEGALWTPPYWGWQNGLYLFHDGYWGQHVGYYGGVNYGFGYMGIGFAGGEWRDHHFAYNTAVMRVNTTVIHNTYINNTVVHNTTIINDRRVAYAGGPGGIRHNPGPDEMRAMHEQHVAPTQFQQQHVQAARTDHNSYVKFNGGRPQQLVAQRPLPAAHVNPPSGGMANPGGRTDMRPNSTNQPEVRPAPTGRLQSQPAPAGRPDVRQAPELRNNTQQRPNTAPQYQPQQRQASPQYQPQQRPAVQPQVRPVQPQYQPQSRPAPQPRPEQQARPAPAPRTEPQSRPAPQSKPDPREREHR